MLHRFENYSTPARSRNPRFPEPSPASNPKHFNQGRSYCCVPKRVSTSRSCGQRNNLQHLPLQLTPVQREACDGLSLGISMGQIVILQGRVGSGKTTILQQIADAHQGILLGARQFVDALKSHQPQAIEEAFLSAMDEALDRSRHGNFRRSPPGESTYATTMTIRRRYLLDVALTAILDKALRRRQNSAVCGRGGDARAAATPRLFLEDRRVFCG